MAVSRIASSHSSARTGVAVPIASSGAPETITPADWSSCVSAPYSACSPFRSSSVSAAHASSAL